MNNDQDLGDLFEEEEGDGDGGEFTLSMASPPQSAPQPPAPPPAGIPEDWYVIAERGHLQVGDWRFFEIMTDQRDTSIREDNWVLQGDQPRIGEEGLATFLQDQGLPQNPQAIPPEVLAGQAGMFLIRGHSRRSCGFDVLTDPGDYAALAGQLHAPESNVDGNGTFHHRCWLKRSGGTQLQQFTVTLPPGGPIQVEEQWIYDAG